MPLSRFFTRRHLPRYARCRQMIRCLPRHDDAADVTLRCFYAMPRHAAAGLPPCRRRCRAADAFSLFTLRFHMLIAGCRRCRHAILLDDFRHISCYVVATPHDFAAAAPLVDMPPLIR